MVKSFFLNKEISHKYLNFCLLTSSAPFGPIFPQWQREAAKPQGRRAPCPQATAASPFCHPPAAGASFNPHLQATPDPDSSGLSCSWWAGAHGRIPASSDMRLGWEPHRKGPRPLEEGSVEGGVGPHSFHSPWCCPWGQEGCVNSQFPTSPSKWLSCCFLTISCSTCHGKWTCSQMTQGERPGTLQW